MGDHLSVDRGQINVSLLFVAKMLVFVNVNGT